MKNIKTAHLIFFNIFLIIIIFFNYIGYVNKKKYIFERKYKENKFVLIQNSTKISDSIFTPIFPSNTPNIYHKNKNKFKFIFYDTKIKKIDSNFFNIKNNLFPLYVIKDSIICADEFANIFINNNPMNIKGLKISSIKKHKNNFYALGEYYKDKNYFYGFFKIDNDFKEIKLINIINKNTKSSFSENSLKSNGFFSNNYNSDTIIYTTNKSSNIWIFHNYELLNKINTLDKTPFPKIIKKDDYLVYDRGSTYNTNMASFIYKNTINVFSNRNIESKKITIDTYDLKGNYIYSSLINDLKNKTDHISQIFQKNNNLIVIFDNNNFLELKFNP